MISLAGTLASYSLQVAILVAVAAAAAAALRLSVPSARLAYWRGVGAVCLLLPLLAYLRPQVTAASVAFMELTPAPVSTAAPAGPWLPAVAAPALVWIYAAGFLVRLGWLAAGGMRLRRIRARSTPASVGVELEALRQEIAPRAEFRATADIEQPVTWGLKRPVVLLPSRFGSLGPEAQRAVACHELLHVGRRDWAWIVVEEHARALFWFHPAAWWVLEQVQLSREQLIDRTVVARTAAKRAYMEALLTFADADRVSSPSMAFLRRRHLRSRLEQLSKEPHMSARRIIWTMVALALVTGVSAAAVARALPLDMAALRPQAASPTRMEIRLAETEAGFGLVPAAGPAGDAFYLHPEAVVTAADVTGANVVEVAGSQFAIAVRFSEPASARMLSATQSHLGRPVAVLLDGEVIAAPTVRSPIGGSAVITGNFTESEATSIAGGLAPNLPEDQVSQDAPLGSKEFGLTMPTVALKVNPRYTAAAMAAKITGTVMMTAVVRDDGTVGDVKVIESLDAVHGLDEQAIAALKQWKFRPGQKAGKPVPVRVTIEMQFTLK